MKHKMTKRHLQIGGTIKPIMGKLLNMLKNDIIDFLPSSKLMELDMKHYLNMIDYRKLQNIIDNNPEYKESPTIQELFNYNSFKLDDNSNIIDTTTTMTGDAGEVTHHTPTSFFPLQGGSLG